MTTIIVSTLLVLIVLPLLALFWLLRRGGSLLQWTAKAAAVGAYVGATYFLGPWHMLSYYGRYGLLAAYGVVLLVGAWRMRLEPLWKRPRRWQWMGFGGAIVLLLVSAALLMQGYRAEDVPPDPVELTFPLQEGRYYVASGGSTSLMNPHMKVAAPEYQKWRGQTWALDVVELYPTGNRARGLYPTALDQFAIFGTPVYAPCDGQVVAVENAHPDLIPPKRDTTNKAGNYALLQCSSDAYVVLAHLKQNSVVVADGDSVRRNDLIGEIGNSGNSWEPHLHMNAQQGAGASTLMDADPRPMTFDGRFPVRNDVLRGVGAVGREEN